MTKTKCELCGFEGHGYQQSNHWRTYHVLSLPITIIQFDKESNSVLVETQDFRRLWIEIQKEDMPKGEIAKIEIRGERYLRRNY